MISQSRVATPCVGLCSTTFGDSVCRGCKRFAHEIVDWNRYDEHQKAMVINRLTQIVESIVPRYMVVTDPDRLQNSLKKFGFRFRFDQSPQCWAYDLFRQTKGRIDSLKDVGLMRNQKGLALDHRAMWNAMSSEFLALSEGHYEIFFKQPLSFD